MGINEITDIGEFDIVICLAVLTEIPDLLGAIEKIKKVAKELVFIEMNIANPLLYIPSPKKSVLTNKIRGGFKCIC